MPVLQDLRIIFTTTSASAVNPVRLPNVHVFVKNRASDTSRGEGGRDFISNLLAFQEIEEIEQRTGVHEINPFLAYGLTNYLATLGGFPPKVSVTGETTVILSLRSRAIDFNEIELPVVNIHLADIGYYFQWSFTYQVRFFFDNNVTLTYDSDNGGVPGITLDTDNPNYSGICREFRPIPPRVKEAANPVYLTQVKLEFGTHHDGKAADSKVNVHIANRLDDTTFQDIAIATDVIARELKPPGKREGPDPDKDRWYKTAFPGDAVVSFDSMHIPLVSQFIRLQDLVLPVVYINMIPTGGDRWIFDYRVTFTFSDGQSYSSTTAGVVLDAADHKHAGVYNGGAFPALAPPGPPVPPEFDDTVVTDRNKEKRISLDVVRRKALELITNRTGTGSQDPPIFKVILYHTLKDQSNPIIHYFDFQTITADAPAPGMILPTGVPQGVRYTSSPSTLGILEHDAVFEEPVESDRIFFNIDGKERFPITVTLVFKTPFDVHFSLVTDNHVHFDGFSVEIGFTLVASNGKVDLFQWVHDIDNFSWKIAGAVDGITLYAYDGEFLGTPMSGTTENPDDFRDSLLQNCLKVHVSPESYIRDQLRDTFRRKIFDMLRTPGVITEESLADRINNYVNAWLLGGAVTGHNRCTVKDVKTPLDGRAPEDTVIIEYTAPPKSFCQIAPLNWPKGFDFSPGNLANIKHIVVLTMENRSFDHMLGYLSLPVSQYGQGRKDVDGLKGDEFNYFKGQKVRSFRLPPGDTIFSPDPPHDHELVAKAINFGKMDGFVAAYAEERGPEVAHRIMGYHTAENVPVYDALARDFTICHRWFACHPGSTFPNRFFELTGRLNINADSHWALDNSIALQAFNFSSPRLPALTKTIFDYLPERITWKYFEHGYCFLRFFSDHTFDSTHIASFADPASGFLALARKGQLPNVSFIDPHFIEMPPGGNCDGPPADVTLGQQFVRQVVEAVVTSPQWEETLLIITYDEHGGFYDHVPPPKAVPVSKESIGTYGVRVPAFLVSPWVKAGGVFGYDSPVAGGGSNTSVTATPAAAPHINPLASLHFDHTSILKTICRCFLRGGEDPAKNEIPYLGKRFAAANDLAYIVRNQLRPNQFRPFIPYSFVYLKSKKTLEVQKGSPLAGAALWQNDANGSDPQFFRFEDAGNGYWYVRTFTGNLYMTADESGRVCQDAKYPPNGTAAMGNDPNTQRWKFTPGVSPHMAGLTISNAAFPARALQSSGNSSKSEAFVVLADAEHIVGGGVRNPWQVACPLMPSGQLGSHA